MTKAENSPLTVENFLLSVASTGLGLVKGLFFMPKACLFKRHLEGIVRGEKDMKVSLLLDDVHVGFAGGHFVSVRKSDRYQMSAQGWAPWTDYHGIPIMKISAANPSELLALLQDARASAGKLASRSPTVVQ